MVRYQRRISGPLMDRLDLFVEVPRVADDRPGGSSEAVRSRVEAMREDASTGSTKTWLAP